MTDLRWLTTERLATLLSEELERDKWGDIDPDLFAMVGAGAYNEEDEHHDDAEALGKVLDRVVARLKWGVHEDHTACAGTCGTVACTTEKERQDAQCLRTCRACEGDGILMANTDTPPNERVTRDSRRCNYCGGKGQVRA